MIILLVVVCLILFKMLMDGAIFVLPILAILGLALGILMAEEECERGGPNIPPY